IPIACFVGAIIVTLPSTGLLIVECDGSIATPYPIIPPENTGSGTSTNLTNFPENGADSETSNCSLLATLYELLTSASSTCSVVSSPYPNTCIKIIDNITAIAEPIKMPQMEPALSAL